MHQILFRLSLRHRPRCGSLQHSPNSLVEFKGPTSKEKEGKDGRRGGKGRRGKEKREEGRVRGEERSEEGIKGGLIYICAPTTKSWLRQ